MKAKTLVLTGDGINCERETARAFQMEGSVVRTVHVNELLENPESLLQYSIFALPGGFSFGDELRSGKILAEKLRTHLIPVFKKFTETGGLTIGVCNGFQVLMQLGVFFDSIENPATLATNDHGKFLDFWTECRIEKSAVKSPWFHGMTGKFVLPVRHKEGRILFREGFKIPTEQIPLKYTNAINGSTDNAAALIDPTGRILGLMPHPEAALLPYLNPLDQSDEQKMMNSEILKTLFKNAVSHEVHR